jgi:hypothetical protein
MSTILSQRETRGKRPQKEAEGDRPATPAALRRQAYSGGGRYPFARLELCALRKSIGRYTVVLAGSRMTV